MRPDSTNVPAPVICTSESKMARGPGLDSHLACTPLGVTVVRKTWLLAVVLALSVPSAPSTGRAFPVNCNANASSFMLGPPLSLILGPSLADHTAGLAIDQDRA